MRSYLRQMPRLKYDSAVRITVDGNSIYAGWSTTSIAALLTARQEFAGGGAEVSTAVSGETWRKLNGLDGGSAADVDASITTAGVKNILVVGEGTNSASSRTGPQIVTDCAEYIAARRSTNPNVYIVLCSGLPRSPNSANNAVINTALNWSDAEMRRDLSLVGADLYVNHRFLAWAAHDGMTLANFTAYESKWGDGASNGGYYVHPSASGVADMVNGIATALLNIPANAVAVT